MLVSGAVDAEQTDAPQLPSSWQHRTAAKPVSSSVQNCRRPPRIDFPPKSLEKRFEKSREKYTCVIGAHNFGQEKALIVYVLACPHQEMSVMTNPSYQLTASIRTISDAEQRVFNSLSLTILLINKSDFSVQIFFLNVFRKIFQNKLYDEPHPYIVFLIRNNKQKVPLNNPFFLFFV